MTIHRSITTLALAACTFAPMAALASSSAAASSDNNANIAPAKGPLVRVTLKNRSNLTQTLIIEGRPVSLVANQEYKIEVPAGTQVFGEDKTVKLTILKEYNGAVASFR